MAPEQARGDKGLTTAGDVYSLGAILYQLLTGRPPFLGATMFEILKQVIEQAPTDPLTLNAEAPTDLAAVCMKCLEKKPEDRYASAEELADDLEAFAAGRSVSVRRLGVWSQVWRAIRHRVPTPKPEESWVAFAVNALAVVIVCHSTFYFLIVSGSRMKWVWVALVPHFVFSVVVRVRMLLRSAAYDTWERLSIVNFTGQTACIIGLALAVLPFDPDAPAKAVLVWYPPLAMLFALGMFVQGGSTRGTNYLFSFLYIVLGVVLRYSGTAAPLVFLAVHTPSILFLARQATAMHRKPEPAVDGADPV